MFDQNEAGQVAAEYWGYVMGGFSNDPKSSLYQSCEATGEFEAVVTISRVHLRLPDDADAVVAGHAVARPRWRRATPTASRPRVRASPSRSTPTEPVGTGPYKFVEYDEANGTDHARGQRRLLGRRAQVQRAGLPRHPRREHPPPGARGRQHRRLRPPEPGRLGRPRGGRQQRRGPRPVQHLLPRPQPRGQPAAEGPQGAPGALRTPSTASSWSRPSCPRAPRSRRSSCPRP